jgi:hypothetical protein
MNQLDPNAQELSTLPLQQELDVETVAALAATDTVPQVGAEAGEAAQPIPTPVPTPIPLRRPVSGRYRGRLGTWELELRVDVDGYRPLKRLSGDYYQVSGATTSYFGSFVVHAISITVNPNEVLIEGLAQTTWPTGYNFARVRIERRSIFQPPAPAVVQWMTPAGRLGARYECRFESRYFRTVEVEQDFEVGPIPVTPFDSYDTGSLPSGGPARTLTVVKAYNEAGIDMLDVGIKNAIPSTAAGPDSMWSNAELHLAMEGHFSLWQELPQWKVWLFHAQAHEFGPGLLGIMFDQAGLQRQGCAGFYQAISGPGAANQRQQLYVCVHELGHCFNLFHSFHKTFMDPPLPNRPGSLSWMNYPRNYMPGGEPAFWSAFPFQFDDLETIHLRHAFRNNIVMGGNPFGKGAALELDREFADRLEDRSGLRLELFPTADRHPLGIPVVLGIRLHARQSTIAHPPELLHPKFGFVQVAVYRPLGDTVVYRPPIEHCVSMGPVRIEAGQTFPVSAYIGYDNLVGQLFSDPGEYKIRAAYFAPDGSIVLSNVLSLRIECPHDSREEEVAELFLGDEQGMLFTLMGSDSEYLANGRKALDTVSEKFADHPFAVYAKMVKGVNAARPFKTITEANQVAIRPREVDEANRLIADVIKASRGDYGLDNLSLYQVMGYLANCREAVGDEKGAKSLRKETVDLAKAKHEPDSVLAGLQA